ncbi:uncharacterized protein LOC126903707 isoform X2 [Daktulosphaira vitifoliae]|uniref:uncharacterized protein LOC126903707 isoform X2 n=1 Tax=Daktulosphaira vitifoliae TaxID=58002 RepID=UPI0021AA5984|nr:uncharacterized protein LOC126903707 isoform X2 [Daktulosphaira vitifoliae]
MKNLLENYITLKEIINSEMLYNYFVIMEPAFDDCTGISNITVGELIQSAVKFGDLDSVRIAYTAFYNVSLFRYHKQMYVLTTYSYKILEVIKAQPMIEIIQNDVFNSQNVENMLLKNIRSIQHLIDESFKSRFNNLPSTVEFISKKLMLEILGNHNLDTHTELLKQLSELCQREVEKYCLRNRENNKKSIDESIDTFIDYSKVYEITGQSDLSNIFINNKLSFDCIVQELLSQFETISKEYAVKRLPDVHCY